MILRHKNLMINVLPEIDPTRVAAKRRFCATPSCAFMSRDPRDLCGLTPCNCFTLPRTCACHTPVATPYYASPYCQDIDPTQIDYAQLKEQLQAALAEVDEAEKTVAQAGQPQTQAEAQIMEDALRAAAEEIGSLKTRLPTK